MNGRARRTLRLGRDTDTQLFGEFGTRCPSISCPRALAQTKCGLKTRDFPVGQAGPPYTAGKPDLVVAQKTSAQVLVFLGAGGRRPRSGQQGVAGASRL